MDITNADFARGIAGTINFTDLGWGIYNMAISGGTPVAEYISDGSTAIALGNNERSITNGMLTDTFEAPAEGEQLYINEIDYLFLAKSVPEPATILLFSTGLVGFFTKKRKT